MLYPKRSAFSLVELLVVIGIIGLLLGILVPAVQQVRAASARVGCLNNLHQIGTAVHTFHAQHGRLPPLPIGTPPGSDPNAHLGWMAILLPQMGNEPLYRTSADACGIDTDPLHDPPHVGLAAVIRSYVCPSDSRLLEPLTDRYGVRASFTSYVAIKGAFPPGGSVALLGALGLKPGIRLDEIADGTSSTLMVGERPPPDSLQAGWWYPGLLGYGQGLRGPNNGITLGGGALFATEPCIIVKGTFGPGRTENPCDRFHLWSLHPGGANFLFADNSARFLSYSAEPLMAALASRNGGEPVQLPD